MGRPFLSWSALSAMCQRWMMANGLPLMARHSTVLVVELNGPNQVCAAGSRDGAKAVAADRDGFAQIVLADQHDEPRLARADPDRRVVDAVAGAVDAAVLWRGRRVGAADCLGAGLQKSGQPLTPISVSDASHECDKQMGRVSSDGLEAEPSIFYDVGKLGTVQAVMRETPDIGRGIVLEERLRIHSPFKSVSVSIRHACHFIE